MKFIRIKIMDSYLEDLLDTIKSKKNDDPSVSYTAQLHSKGINEILKKIGEESSETIIAAKGNNNKELIHEIADLWFHCLVLLSEKNLTVKDVTRELKSREGTSGIEEKNNRKIK
jgi:phosphoribosyl-ATP pyrophosphohydrolase|tara:strand:+ start:238 stop:582 length:345 start_codon:yes stop_codon:yes gene_type:complete